MPGGELVLKQKYQILSGRMNVGKRSAAIKSGKMAGQQITLSVGSAVYTGLVNGNTIEGVARSPSGKTKWLATRAD